jgi:hypothetical protein
MAAPPHSEDPRRPTTAPPEFLGPEPDARAHLRARVERLASWLDDRFEIPGLGVSIGWDAILGLVPGLGDVLSTLMSLWIVMEARQAGAPSSVITHMLANIVLDSAAGAIPVIGDLADVAIKSNRRNARLLESWLHHPTHVEKQSRWKLVLAILGAALALIASLTAAILLARLLLRVMGLGA